MLPLRLLILGLLSVCLIACGGGGGATTPPATPPVILAVGLPSQVLQGATHTLQATVQGPVDAWLWTFGEGDGAPTSTESRPVLHFLRPGKYTASVVATNTAGASEPFLFSTTVIIDGVVPEPPVIQAIVPENIVAGFEGELVTFSATATNLPERWEWTFFSGISKEVVTDATPIRLLADAGEHEVLVRAFNAYGASEGILFRYQVAAQSVAWPPVFQRSNVGGEMGAPGEQIRFNFDGTQWPFAFDWQFDDDDITDPIRWSSPLVTLGPSGLHTGSVSSANRAGDISADFIYSTGGFESTRMASQWGSAWNGLETIIPLDDGRIAAFVTGNPPDLDPRMTTMFRGHPDLVHPGPPTSAAIVFTDATGAPGQIWTWEAPIYLINVARGPQQNLLVLLRYFPAPPFVEGQGTVNIAPVPGNRQIAAADASATILACVDYTGVVQWYEARDLNYGHGVITGPDGSIFLTFDGSDRVYVDKIDAQGHAQWTRTLPGDARCIRGTPEGGIVYLDQLEMDRDVDGSNEWVDFKTRIGFRDGLLGRYSANGDYLGTIQWGGPPTGSGHFGSVVAMPQDLIVRPDSSVVITGTWGSDPLDFDPGPGEHYLTTVNCTPQSDEAARMYALHLTATGDFRAVQVWDVAPDGTPSTPPDEIHLADFGAGGYAIGWPLSHCIGSIPIHDLDPGPGTHFPQPDSDFAVVRVDADGNLLASAEWVSPDGRIASLIPRADGGLHMIVHGDTPDMDPGPGVFDPTPFAGIHPRWHVFLNATLDWSAPR